LKQRQKRIRDRAHWPRCTNVKQEWYQQCSFVAVNSRR
jgi:hypothetical protein